MGSFLNMVQNAFIIMYLFIPSSISILCNKNDFSKAGSKLSVGLLATNLALLKKYYQLAIVHIANAKSMLRNWKYKKNVIINSEILMHLISVKWKLTACWDEKHWEKKLHEEIHQNPLPTFQMSKYTFRQKKLVCNLIFEMKLA